MPTAIPDMFFSATRNTTGGTIYVKIINRSLTPRDVKLSITGLTSVASSGKAITLSSASVNDTNSITDPHKVEPVTANVTGLGSEFTRTVPASSLTVLELSAK
jgi:alpha-N-arabinofuranosidase